LPSHEQVPEICPYCGRNLSPWEQILLSVDRAIRCKGCWYRIIIDTYNDDEPKLGNHKPKLDAPQ
jgi:DNA-directed RNA polymerase subunit RPC12/RpoP